jgi:Tol biopolymer transport system component
MTFAERGSAILIPSFNPGAGMRFVRTIAVMAVVASPLAAQTSSQLYQRATEMERAHGKLDSAIVLYQRVVASPGVSRSLAARALLRLGAAYEVQGRNEARAAYSRLVRDYGEQGEAAEARRRLAELDGTATQAGEARGMRLRQLWSSVDAPSFAAVSSDAETLVFTDWTTGDLARRDLASGVTVRLTNKGPWEKSSAFAEGAAISPDGRTVAYAWFTDSGSYELRTVPLAGGPSTVVPLPRMYYVMPFAWMPDGRGVLASVHPHDGTPGDGHIAIVNVNGQVRRISPDQWNGTSVATVSPDGRWIAFDVVDSASALRDLRIASTDGAVARMLVTGPANDWFPMWTPDGRSVAFLSDRTGVPVLMIVDVSEGEPNGQPRTLKSDFGGNHPFGFTRSGGLVYGPRAPSSDIVVARVRIDSATISVERSATRSFVGRNQFPSWSPDGNVLAFVSARGTGTGLPFERIPVLVDMRTGAQREFPNLMAYMLRARWSADGRTLLLAGRRAVGDREHSLYAFDPERNTLEQIGAPAELATYEATLGGRGILHTRNDTAMGQLRRFTFADRREEVIYRVEGKGRIGSFAESPDGKYIAVTALHHQGTSDSRTETLILAQDGSVVRRLPNVVPTGYFQLQWPLDGRFLVGVAPRAVGNERYLWRIPVDGSAATRFNLEPRVISTFRLTRDGTRAAILMDDPGQTAPAVWLVENLVPPASR